MVWYKLIFYLTEQLSEQKDCSTSIRLPYSSHKQHHSFSLELKRDCKLSSFTQAPSNPIHCFHNSLARDDPKWIFQRWTWELQSFIVNIFRNTQEETVVCLTFAPSSVESWESIFLKPYFNWEGCFELPGDYFAHLLFLFINLGINCHMEIT